MATIQDIEAAMNSLRAEVPSIIAPLIAASVTALRNEVGGSVAAALAELRQHSATTAQQVAGAVQTQFQQAATGFSDDRRRCALSSKRGKIGSLRSHRESLRLRP